MLASALVWCHLPYSAVCNSGKGSANPFAQCRMCGRRYCRRTFRVRCVSHPHHPPELTHTHTYTHTYTHTSHIPLHCALLSTSVQCSFMEYREYKVVYRRYASLFFIVGTDQEGEVRTDTMTFQERGLREPPPPRRGGGICVCVLEGNGGCAPCAHHGVVAAGVCGCGSRT